jgi:chemotaxis regulatin CheY-phosphate phosphatase CheZ
VEQLPQLTEDEFEHIEEEIARTTKGRSFLRRFRRRAMGAATEEIRTMLEEFRLSWRQQTQVLEAAGRVNVLRQELIEMAASIERARREIAALQPADADNNRIITATNELDAIVISTERASFEILNAAEHLMELSGQFREGGAAGDLCNSLEADVTAIFTACSFQDLTGQRTSKVVNALRYIEQRIIAVISIWGATDDSSAPIADEWADKREDAHLLSGPQREGKGVSQHDVDRMFESDEFVPAPAKSAPTSLPSRGSAFAGKEANQSDIDSLFDSPAPAPAGKSGGMPKAQQSQSDIDSLFDSPAPAPAGKSGGMPKAQQSQSDIDALFDVEPPAPTLHDQPDQRISHFDKHQSQSDIDSLFNSTAPPTPKPPPKLQNQADMDALFDSSVPTPSKSATTLQSQSDIDALFDAPPAKTTPPPRAAKAAPPPPPEAKPKPKAKPPEPGAALDQSAIDALFG